MIRYLKSTQVMNVGQILRETSLISNEGGNKIARTSKKWISSGKERKEDSIYNNPFKNVLWCGNNEMNKMKEYAGMGANIKKGGNKSALKRYMPFSKKEFIVVCKKGKLFDWL